MVCSVTTGVMSAGMSSMIRVRDDRQAFDRAVALGTSLEGMILVSVDAGWSRATRAGMSGLGPLWAWPGDWPAGLA